MDQVHEALEIKEIFRKFGDYAKEVRAEDVKDK
jgi:hypothetical protein